jgi:ribose transport system ATP-binding protein
MVSPDSHTSSPKASKKILELRGITKRFVGVRALGGVDLELYSGEILALLGENGAGKSTLMKILSGVYKSNEGTIHFEGREVKFERPDDAQALGISIIYQEFSLVPYLTAAENLFFGREKRGRFGNIDRTSMNREARVVLKRLGVEIDVTQPVAHLSIAEQQFVEIGKALARSTRILILDEPTATLTPQEADRLFEIMRELKRSEVAMIFISHHLDEIFQIADRVQCLRDGSSVGTKPIGGCTTEELVRMIAGRDITQVFPARSGKSPGPVVLEVRALQRKPNLPELSFNLREGEILGFAGLVGSGRTEVMRALIGADPVHVLDASFKGKNFRPKGPADSRALGIGLLPEDRKRQGLILPFAVSDNIVLTDLRTVSQPAWRGVNLRRCAEIVSRYIKEIRIKTPSGAQAARNLSGGNQQKVVIAKWLHAKCRVLIFDEPTRGIDVGAKSEIYELMRKLTAEGDAIIMVSSELPEVVGLSDRVIVMRQQRFEKILERPEEITPENIMYYATGSHNA